MRVDLKWGDTIGVFGSRFFYSYGPATPTAGDLDTASATISGFASTDLGAAYSAAFRLVEVQCTDLDSVDGAVGRWDGSLPGALSGDPLTSNVSADLDLSISSRYRGGHPVMHLPPPNSEQIVSPRTWSADYITTLSSAGANFLEDLNSNSLIGDVDGVWVVLRGYRPGAEPGAVTPYPVQSTHGRQYVGTMRRRARALR